MYYPLNEKSWWEGWRQDDFSIDGLHTKPAAGCAVDSTGALINDKKEGAVRPASQFDLWHADDGELIPELNDQGVVIRRWTPLHLPLVFADGSPAKAAWTEEKWLEVEDRLRQRLARLTTEMSPTIDGAVLRTPFFSDWARPSFTRSMFTSRVRDQLRLASFHCYNCVFADTLDLSESSFPDGVRLERSLFRSSAWFYGVDFGRSADFSASRFESEVGFAESRSERQLNLSQVEIDGDLRFDKARHDRIMLGGKFGSITGDHAECRDFALAGSAAGSVVLDHSSLGNVRICCEISGSLHLSNIKAAELSLRRTKIGGDLAVPRSRITGPADLSELTCNGELSFNSTVLEGAAKFTAMSIAGLCDFRGVAWPRDLLIGAFRDVSFPRTADFRGRTPPPFSAFYGASFKAEARFSRAAFVNDAHFRATLPEAKSDDDLEALENGCRVLKYAAEGARDRISEQRFHRYELTCRRKITTTPRSERFFSTIYAVAGDYGGSLVRPLVNLVALWLIAAGAMVLMGAALGVPVRLSHGIGALETSARHIFQWMNIWSRAFPAACDPRDFESLLTCGGGSMQRLAYRAFATLESFLAGVLIFLTALAVKRRFQIT
jgi:hypothetical protein